ncbi:carotenoid oxygenase [Aulographum hederae CBS 113979]|uniref:Carotenoid oxygenase n=1 Tax=Aulographum hederae CBS 113979 TaxID=1176131 RepID=A0A6G1GKK4_9PEZI|nr:carotenoid oxygenase [Aulographum hederae CBS 113979]
MPKSEPFGNWPNDVGYEPHFEERTPVELSVKGAIPTYACGTLYRTGPGGFNIDTKKGPISFSHWFDGNSQVHRFQLREKDDGTVGVAYNSRIISDARIENIKQTGTLRGFTFGQKHDPCESYFKKVMSTFSSSDNGANVGVTLSVNMPSIDISDKKRDPSKGHASGINTLVTKTDASMIKQIDPETLEPLGVTDQKILHPDLTGPLSAAHAKSDPVTGDVFNFNLAFGRQPTYRVFKVSASTGKTDILATFTATAAYIHSLFLTADHVILCVWNSHLMKGGIQMLWTKNILDAITESDSPAKWFVIDRKHGKGVLATYESDPFFCFHTVNAWTEPSRSGDGKVDIVATLAAFEDASVIKKFYYENLLSTAAGHKDYTGPKGDAYRGQVTKFRLPNVPATPEHDIKRAVLDFKTPKSLGVELPTLNPKFITKPNRYIYGITDRGLSTFADGLAKFDAETQTAVRWEMHAHSPGEPIFVADPKGEKEDDGVLLSVVLDGIKGKSYLLCLDARDLSELGRAEVEGVVGFGFHGTHVPVPQVGKAVHY